MTDGRSTALRRLFFAIALAAAVWAALAYVTGGISIPLGPVRLSSRNPRNPAFVALAALVASWLLAPAGQRMTAMRSEWRYADTQARRWGRRAWARWQSLEDALARVPSWLAPAAATVVALLVVVIGLTQGALVAAGADASGYVTHAQLWASGTLRIEQPLMRELTVEIPREALAPLAWVPAPEGNAIVPVTAPGLPMLMAAFEIAGGRAAAFYVVPLMAGLAIVATYLLGAVLAGRWAGVSAAVLLATSPSFLFQLTSSPMSDIPALAWWALAWAGLFLSGPATVFAAGLAAGAAILTRPNLAPVLIAPALLLARGVWRERTLRGRAGRSALLFTAGVGPACLIIALLFNYWYGSPLDSGYGNVDELFRWEHLAVNASRYPRWLIESQSPLILLALLVPLFAREASILRARPDLRAHALTLLGFVAAVFACYAFYLPFDAWWFLRFLLPAYPALLALTAAAIVIRAARLPRGLRVAIAVAAIAAAGWHGVQYARAGAAFHVDGEWKYQTAGRYVADRLPRNAALLAMQHSGSARYYSDRVTLHYLWIPPGKLDWTIDAIRRAGYEPYLLLEDWEEPDFRARFSGQAALRAFDRAPLAEIAPGRVRIYETRP